VIFACGVETMAKRKRGWSNLDVDDKLEALRDDVNVALDIAEDLKKRMEQVETAINRLLRG
jgi:cell division septum initiation protein DivIVA